MEISVVSIGNSRGIRLPKIILNRLKVTDKMNMSVTDDGIFLSPIRKPREGWAMAFEKMHATGDDILENIPDSENFEWEW